MTAADDLVTLKTGDAQTTFYFPGCSVSRVLAKNNQIISLPGRTKGYDRLQFTDRFRLIGNWYDYPAGTYDGKTAFKRMIDFMSAITSTREKMSFTWKSGSDTDGPHTVMIGAVNIDKDSGDGKRIAYVIELDRVTD